MQNERCIALLNAVAGNVDVKGGFCLPRQYRLRLAGPEPRVPATPSDLLQPAELPLITHGAPGRLLPMVDEGKFRLGMYMLYKANPAYAAPETGRIDRILRDEAKVPFIVCIDTHVSETGLLADLILPAATYLEIWEIETPPAFEMVPLVSLRQPVVKPRGESRGMTEIWTDLANRLGGDVKRHFDFDSPKTYLRMLIEGVPGLVAAGGLEYLQEHGFWFDQKAQARYLSYQERKFDTPSGKFEVYSERLKAAGFSPLPTYVPIPGHESLGEGEFILTTFQFNVHTHWLTGNQMWLSEVVHDNPLWINTETAQRMGIRQGDGVRVISKAGQFETRAWVTEGVHPLVVAVGDGCGHWAYGHIAQAKPYRSRDPETALVWWGKGRKHGTGPGVHPNPAIEARSDPIGGGQAWMDTVVRVERMQATS